MEPIQALIAMVAGVAIGILNNRLLRWCAIKACHISRRGAAATLVIGGYAARYIVIISAVLMLAKFFGAPMAMLFLAGMMFATLGMAVFWRGNSPAKPCVTENDRPASG